MVKKKKNRPAKEQILHNGADSSESADENKSSTAGKCFHVNKAIDLSRVKKSLKSGSLALQCPECLKGGIEEVSSEAGLWLCLRCGHQGCGRTQHRHALEHYQVPHSDLHCLAVHTGKWNVWCYACDEDMQACHRKKLEECVKFLKQQDCPEPSPKIVNKAGIHLKEEDEEVEGEEVCELGVMPLSDVTNSQRVLRSSKKKPLPSLPRVRGLRNLGNTCFFNAVLQCLAQTPFLLELLQDMRHGGSNFTLPGGVGLVLGDEEEKLPALEGHLGKWGVLTEALAGTLEELRHEDMAAVNPQRLLNKLTARCPQFGGGDQHDAHELLRHLLEEVRTEDLKRYWTVILDRFGLTPRDTSDTVDDSVRTKVKAYGRQAGDQLLLPETVFRGLLVSTLECQDCFHSYQRTETFFELSLPVSANKPQPPILRRKSSAEDSYDICGNTTSEAPSKHQLKKERRQQRKGRKKGHKGPRVLDLVGGEPTIAEEIHNSANSEQSDADVEDNLDQEVALKGAIKDVVESGYSSEKAAEGSAVASPVSMVNGDSALASPVPSVEHKELEGEPGIAVNVGLCNGNIEAVENAVMCNNLSERIPDGAAEELSVSIPPMTHSPSAMGSPISNTGSPSPDSSDFNIDSNNHASPESCEMNDDPDRPFSRIAFCSDDGTINSNTHLQTVLASPEESYSNSEQRISGCSSIKDNLSSDSLVKEMATLSLERQSPSHWDTCSAHSLDDSKENKCVSMAVGNGSVEEAAAEPDKDCCTTLAPRYHCEGKECSIESCLNQFTVLELMTGSNKVNCENCSKQLNQGKEGKTVATNSTKQYLVSNPPAVLVLHLKRFEVHENMFRKTPRHVSFPMLLDIAPVCITKCWELPTVRKGQTKILYSLYGVVQHFGSIHGGHYSAYVKVRAPVSRDDLRWHFLPSNVSAQKLEDASNGIPIPTTPLPGKWYHVSDSKVNEVNEDRVLHSQAYLLFYERIW